jgi:hypothetical protein
MGGIFRRPIRGVLRGALFAAPLAATLCLLLAAPAAATVAGGCTLSASSTSGGPVDLTKTRVWHLQSTDHVSAAATAPAAQTTVTVRAYAFGFALPVAGGTSAGAPAAEATDIDMSLFGRLGRVFAVAGSSTAGGGNGCDGEVLIVLDDVNPLLTVLGLGGVVAIVVGGLGVFWSSRRPTGVGRFITAVISMLLVGAGLSLVLQQTADPPESPLAVSSIGRSAFVQSVATPAGVSIDPQIVLQSVLLTLIVLVLLPFPSQLFNATLDEHYDEIRSTITRRRWTSWLWRGRRDSGAAPAMAPMTAVPPAPSMAYGAPAMAGAGGMPGMAPPPFPPPPPPLMPPSPYGAPPAMAGASGSSASSAVRLMSALVVVLLAGLLYGLLDPGFGPDTRSLVTFVGIVLGLVAVTWATSLPHRAIHRQLLRDRGRLWAPAGVLIIAALCVLISRVVGFLPGYLYGLILGYRWAVTLEGRDEARAWAAAGWWMLALATVSWLTLGAVRMPGLEASVPAEIAASVLAALVTAGVEALVFELVPIRFLPGELVFKHRRVHWAVLFALGVFAFAWIILNPANGFLGTGAGVSLFAAVGLFLAFGIVSVLFWGYFRFRPERPARA